MGGPNNAKYVASFKRRVKIALIKAFGDKCQLCGNSYEDYIYDFHHIDPSSKKFGISTNNTTHSRAGYAEEAKKCCMVCANCHRKIEHGSEQFNLISNFDEEIYYKTLEEIVQKNIHNKPSGRVSKAPSREILKELAYNETFVSIANKYEVTDAAIRKWLTKYGLPNSKTLINMYSKEEWDKL